MTSSPECEVGKRPGPHGSSRLELLLFHLGEDATGRRELFGLNVFKVREAMTLPEVTYIPGLPPHVLGVANIRDQVIPIVDLPAVVGNVPTALNILIVTEYERSVHGFAVEDVQQIARLDWGRVLSAEAHAVGGMVTSIARLDRDLAQSRIALVLDVEKILRDILPSRVTSVDPSRIQYSLNLPPGAFILAADDSFVARSQIEQVFEAMQVPYLMTKTGGDAWERLQALAQEAAREGLPAQSKVAIVLTDLEMPEMDGFTLTRKIKEDDRLKDIPVVIHSSLTGHANEEHAQRVGADGYVAKFVGEELATALLQVWKQRTSDLVTR